MPSTYSFKQSRSLKNSALAESALTILHDYDKLMRCRPLIGQTEYLSAPPDRAKPNERSSEHHWFRQTEDVNVLPFGIWKKKVMFENYVKELPDNNVPGSAATSVSGSIYSPVEGGVECKTYAPGLKIKAVFKVVKRRPHSDKVTLRKRDQYTEDEETAGGWLIVEESEMICESVLTKWFNVPQHKKAHKQMLENIVHEASKRAYGGNAVRGQ